MHRLRIILGLFLFFEVLAGCGPAGDSSEPWPMYGGDPYGTRYSPLDQIDRSNVDQLEVAWTYHTGDAVKDGRHFMEATPIIVDGTMYLTTPRVNVVALDPATGNEVWRHDPYANEEGSGAGQIDRGVTYWDDGSDRRILFTAGHYLRALNADTGEPIPTFGDSGRVDLNEGLGRSSKDFFIALSTPGVIYQDLIIIGSRTGEGVDAAPGHVRAYNVRTGKQEWIFHTIPQPGEFGHDTWEGTSWKTAGGANAWGGLTVDPERGMVFFGTGSPAPDFYGGARGGKNLFGNSIVALDAATGERVWHFQTVHHDLWDYDIPAPPNLVTIQHEGEQVDALAQVTKTGNVFLFNRETGEPLFPIEERPVPASNLPGEEAWPTQPFPTKPPAFARQGFTRDMITDISEASRREVTRRFDKLRGGEMYIPPSRNGTINLPGTHGGALYGGASFDPTTGLLYVNANNVPNIFTMIETAPGHASGPLARGLEVYRLHCTSCHGEDREGDPPSFPSLVGIDERMSDAEIEQVIADGQGRMPGFPQLSASELDNLVAFLAEDPGSAPAHPVDGSAAGSETEQSLSEPPFVSTGYHQFRDSSGYSAVKPPWGTLNAIDLGAGEIRWQVPLGEFEELSEKGIPVTGREGFGGTIVTDGGLVLVAATTDEKFRAFDKSTGELLWETTLPAGGYATPSTYMVDGKQYVVIAAGGGGTPGAPVDDAFVAFALP